jgi:hypothetical protein
MVRARPGLDPGGSAALAAEPRTASLEPLVPRTRHSPRIRHGTALDLRRPQTIADPGFGEEILRPLRIGFDLLAQLADIDAEILRINTVIREMQALS